MPLWERLAGQDYTGWTVRKLRDAGTLKAGEVGKVTRYTFERRRRHYTVAFARVDLLTFLPSPGDVELSPPS